MLFLYLKITSIVKIKNIWLLCYQTLLLPSSINYYYYTTQESRKSSVLKRDLPRPAEFDSAKLFKLINSADSNTPEQLIAQEMIALLHHDATMYPTTTSHKNNNATNSSSTSDLSLSFIPDDLLAAARAEVMKEYNNNNNSNSNNTDNNTVSLQLLWEEVHKPYMYLPQDEYQCCKHQSTVSNNKEMQLEALMTHFTALRAKVDKVRHQRR